jgi:bacterioferritin-associated ferredoxin
VYICSCEAVTDGQIRGVAESGITDFEELQKITNVSTRCKRCKPSAKEVFAKAVEEFKKKFTESGECHLACVGCTEICDQRDKRERKKDEQSNE